MGALLESVWRERTEEACNAAVMEVQAEAEKRGEEQRREAEARREARLTQAHEDFASRREALKEPLKQLESLIGKGMTLQQRSQASASLAGALLALQGAL